MRHLKILGWAIAVNKPALVFALTHAAPNQKIKNQRMKIKEIYLFSDDLKATELFYREVLGIRRFGKEKNSLSFFTGSTKLTFHRSEKLKPVYHLAFDIPHNQIDEALEWLRKRTAIVPVSDTETIADFTNWDARSIYFYDNNGNILELICRFALDNHSEKPFDSSSILHVSEIGMVTDHVPGLCEQIRTQYKLPIFARQQPTEKFAAIGDDEGLFIVVDSHREWCPTQQKSNPFPIKVVFDAPIGSNQVLHFR